jgi:hypothetical protein
MPIKVFFDKDKPYAEADTLEEAIALLKLGFNGAPSRRGHAADSLAAISGQTGGVYRFFLSINENARKILLALLKHEKGIRGEEFSEETGFPSEKFGGILGGASKIAKNNGLKIEHFVISNFVVEGTERYRFYKPGKLLLEYADKLKHVAMEGALSVE